MTEPTPEFEERRTLSIWERLEEVGLEYRTGHKAHRTRIEQLEHNVDALADDVKALTVRLDAPVEATKLRFSPQVLIAICLMTVSLVGGAYGVSNRVMNRLDAFEERINRQADSDKTERANTAKLLEERYMRSEKQFEAFGRQMELMKYEQQRLREDVTNKKGSSR